MVSRRSASSFSSAEPALRGRGGRHRKEVADVEEDFEHQLIAHVCRVELLDPVLVAGGAGPFVCFAVEGFEVAKDSVTCAHGRAGVEGMPRCRGMKEDAILRTDWRGGTPPASPHPNQASPMTLSDAQRRVDAWISQFEEGYFDPLTNMTRLAEEVGELAREVNHRFGQKTKKPGEAEGDMGMEMADILFVLICMANREGIDLQESFDRMMAKVEGGTLIGGPESGRSAYSHSSGSASVSSSSIR